MPANQPPSITTDVQIDQALSLLGVQPAGVLDTSNSVSSLSTEDAQTIRKLMFSEAQRRNATTDSQEPVVLFANANDSIGP